MGLDYGEILCTAVDEIVSTRLQGLSYDITKLCTIVDDTYSYQGKYKVSDGTAKYDAFSSDNNLKKGNTVLVTIPNGDYSMQKIIKGRVAATDTTPFKYTSPLDTMVSLKQDILDAPQGGDAIKEKGLVANGAITNIGPIYSIKNASGLSGFTRLGISADFKSLLSGLDVAQGTYGIKLLIESEGLERPGVTKPIYYDLNFTSADMIGNPYQFDDYFTQEKVFDISYVEKIKSIEVYFYQNKDFKDGNGNLISLRYSSNSDIGLSELYTDLNNLFVDNVQVYLGYDVNEFKGETLLIYSNESMSYHYTDESRKNMELRWVHQLEDGKHFTILSKSNFDQEKYSIQWFKYSPGYESLNKYAKKDWEEISADSNNPFKCSFGPDIKKQKEQIKVVGLIKDLEQKTEAVYFSNLLTFENEEYVPDPKTQDASTALSIYCKDDSEGNYFLYDQNGKIINQGLGQGYQRTWQALFKGAQITSGLGTLDWIRWYFPYDEEMNRSMLIMDGYFTKKEIIDTKYTYKGTNYYVIERKPAGAVNKDGLIYFESDEQSYSIANQWNYKNSNNTVICRVSVDGVEYEAIEELRFGKAGSNGTNTTLLLEFDNNQNALIAEEGATIDVSLHLYNDSGEQSGFSTGMSEDISWSWYKTTTKEENGKEVDKGYMIFQNSKNDKGDTIVTRVTITSKVKNVPSDNYYILQASYNGMTTYLPIPLKDRGASYIEGAREVIYNHQGIPSYYNDAYRLYEYNPDEKTYKEKYVNWDLECADSFRTASDYKDINYMPKLKKKIVGGQDKYALSAALFYTSGFSEKVCVSAFEKIDDNKMYYWAQPILIMQSRYDFAMLNQWDGTLSLDEDNSTILAAMLGAGRKDTDNTFSGVLIGDIQKGTNNGSAETKTGVYGIQKGVVSYALTEDGKATLGANGNGQIIIDGSESVIKTKGYDTKGSSGMKIDLNSGILDIRNNGWDSLIHLSAGLENQKKDEDGNTIDDPYFLIRTQQGKNLIRIDDNNYYLQSNNYSQSQGSKFDLMTGEFTVNGNNGRVRLLPALEDNSILQIDYLDRKANGDINSINRLMQVGGQEYYLQSKDYSVKETVKVYDNSEKEVGNLYMIYGMKLVKENDDWHQQDENFSDDMQYVTIIEETLATKEENQMVKNIYKTNLSSNGKYYKDKKPIIFDKIDRVVQGEYSSDLTITMYTSEQNKQRFLSKAQVQYKDIANRQPRGFRLDMNNNMLIGYDLRITAINQQDKSKNIIIDSGDPEYPLRIGKNFSVDWDGKVTCSNPTINGWNGTINLGKFYMNSSGAGGGVWNDDSTGVQGYVQGDITSGGKTIGILKFSG